MSDPAHHLSAPRTGIVLATGEAPLFRPGETVRILTRAPVGHYRVQTGLSQARGMLQKGPAALTMGVQRSTSFLTRSARACGVR